MQSITTRIASFPFRLHDQRDGLGKRQPVLKLTLDRCGPPGDLGTADAQPWALERAQRGRVTPSTQHNGADDSDMDHGFRLYWHDGSP